MDIPQVLLQTKLNTFAPLILTAEVMIDTLRNKDRLERGEPKHNPRRNPTREDGKNHLSWTTLATFIDIDGLPTQSLCNGVFVCRRAGSQGFLRLFSDRGFRRLQHVVADFPRNRAGAEVLSYINFGLTVNALQGRDVLDEGHRALC